MASQTQPEPLQDLPKLPVAIKDFIPHFSKNSQVPVQEILEPYKAYEAKLRKYFAQAPDHEAIKDGFINTVPVFSGLEAQLKVRARNLAAESQEDKEKYVFTLPDDERKPHGSPAVVSSIKEFKHNFNIFSESSLSELDWNNVVAAGSSVTTSLLPVPENWAGSKKSLREYYHQHLAPASDVDLFLYGLNEEEGKEKIKDIERAIKDSILHECTTIRTKNAVTIVSQYPTRHVQIVLRLYDSISQIITGFDVDCSCAAFDGNQVYASPRALAAFATQINTVDLSRRSPSYENRLSKYSHRGFEVYWPLLNRSRIDPTIFERSFPRTLGLARLLVLEKLPKSRDREVYAERRRKERGRPPKAQNQFSFAKRGDIKAAEEDEVAEWVEEDQISDYHTMVLPYGEKFPAAKIKKLLYTKDLLLNSEWNIPKDREVNLHRHPCFFGTAEEVLDDCCGYCPVPKTDEELEVAAEESKIYISGPLTFIRDDPGRQEIGSFNPITTDDWTEMAYVGNTQMLCQAIVDSDVDYIQSWCQQEANDVNTRDYVGRTPLHLATVSGNANIVKVLVENGARIVARLLDGRSALHIAAQAGNLDIVKILMDKSLANEEEEEEKKKAKKAAVSSKKLAPKPVDSESDKPEAEDSDDDESAEDTDTEDYEMSDEESDKVTRGSFVKVKIQAAEKPEDSNDIPEDDADEPDVYDINVLAWDFNCTPLHFTIIGGQVEMIRLLVEGYGADVLLPIKVPQENSWSRKAAIMSLFLALSLPVKKAKEVVRVLLELGATSAQADMEHFTALHYIVAENGLDVLDTVLEHDGPAAKSMLDYVTLNTRQAGENALTIALQRHHEEMASKLLTLGAKPTISFDDFIKPYIAKFSHVKSWTTDQSEKEFMTKCTQPILYAAALEFPSVMKELLAKGADPNTLSGHGNQMAQNPNNSHYYEGASLLDIVRHKLDELRDFGTEQATTSSEPETLKDESHYLTGLKPGTYKYWTAQNRFRTVKAGNEMAWKIYKENIVPKDEKDLAGVEAKKAAVARLVSQYEEVEKLLLNAGGKTFKELYPNVKSSYNHPKRQGYVSARASVPYETTFNFHLPDLNAQQREGYFRLFEAIWSNDIDEVKALTLGSWKSPNGEENPPLKIAVSDSTQQGSPYNYYMAAQYPNQLTFTGLNTFQLAVLRGPSYYKLARVIMEIALAQYQPDDNKSIRSRWTIEFNDDDDSDYCSDGDSDEVHLRSELLDDNYTIDNVAAVSTVVKSHVKPIELVEALCNSFWFLPDWWSSKYKFEKSEAYKSSTKILEYAVYADDIGLLRFLYQLCNEQVAHFSDGDSANSNYKIDTSVFTRALSLGRTSILGELIKTSGVGIPLDKLVKKTGVQMKEKPKYYQGLNVDGKKNKRWAEAANPNRTYNPVVQEKNPPLLLAAYRGSIESVQWLMSDIPAQKYKEFAATHKDDKRVKILEQSKAGFEKTITQWLGSRNDLVLHCAILWKPCEKKKLEYIALVKYLLSVAPDLLEHKNTSGLTPLHVAVGIRQPEIIQLLLAEGANHRAVDKEGQNIVHHIILPSGRLTRDATEVRKLLELFDKKQINEMLKEKSDGKTPLALWMEANPGVNENRYRNNPYQSTVAHADIIQVLMEFSDRKELEIFNANGDLPLHVAIKNKLPNQVAFLLSLAPHTLLWENTTGRMALDLATDAWLSQTCKYVPNLTQMSPYQDFGWDTAAILARGARSFVSTETVKREFVEALGLKGEDFEGTEGNSFGELRDEVKAIVQMSRAVEAQLLASYAAGDDTKVARVKRKLVGLFDANEVTKRAVSESHMSKKRYVSRATPRRQYHEEEDEEEKEEEEEKVEQDEVAVWFGSQVQQITHKL